MTADENDLYQDLTGQGAEPAQLTDAAIDAQVLASGPGGVDPIPWIRRLRVPVLWVYGGRDRHIPPRLSERRLEPIAKEAGRDFTIADFPKANHALVETTTGLTAEMLRSDDVRARHVRSSRGHGCATTDSEADTRSGATVRAGRLAQLVEHLLYTQGVAGSSPAPPMADPAANRQLGTRLDSAT